MSRKKTETPHNADLVVVRTRRGTVYCFVTLRKERKTLRISCPGFDFLQSFNRAERRITDLWPGVEVTWDNVQIERGVAFGWFD